MMKYRSSNSNRKTNLTTFFVTVPWYALLLIMSWNNSSKRTTVLVSGQSFELSFAPTGSPQEATPTVSPTTLAPSVAPIVAASQTPSITPVAQPTEQPVPEASSVPTIAVTTLEPTTVLSVAPTVAPTVAPVTPTAAPVPATPEPTESTSEPTIQSSSTPSIKPTTGAPSPMPVPDATPSPSEKASSEPSVAPVVAPITPAPTTSEPSSAAPVIIPTTPSPTTGAPSTSPSSPAPTEDDASKSPTGVPSFVPSSTPSVTPSSYPSTLPTKLPSHSPVSPGEPTYSPTTAKPSRSPSYKPVSETLSKVIALNFSGRRRKLLEQSSSSSLRILQSQKLDDNDKAIFENATADWTEKFYQDNPNILNVNSVTSTVKVYDQVPEGNSLKIAYDERVEYWTSDGTTAEEVSGTPLSTPKRQSDYTNFLQEEGTAAGSDTFNTLSGVTVPGTPTPAPTPTPTPGGKDDDDGFWTTWTIVGISVGGAVALLLLLGGGYWYFNRRNSGGDAYIPADKKGDVPPATVGGFGNDDISTLEDPTQKSGMRNADDMTGYGDQSVATMDYDYAKAYGGDVDHSVSDAGGTFGSATHTKGDSTALGAMGVAAGVGAAGASLASDDDSFDRQYRSTNTREETFDVYAPQGKLGVVIDTPDDGAPCVHAIKESSVIADKLQVGDKLLAVDDQDVRSMTAIKVSKLISRKSNNPTRKLTIGRTLVLE